MSAKRRRSRRVSKSERVMVSLSKPVPVQDIAVTVDLSAHGSKVLARRKLPPNGQGMLQYISAGRQVPCRIVWQKPPGPDGRMETGVEIFSNTNFWGLDLSGSELESEVAATPAPAAPAPSAPMPPADSPELWAILVDELEAKGVVTRAELIERLQRLAK
jgi:hypothetical protein